MAFVFVSTSLYMQEKHVVPNVALSPKIKYECKKHKLKYNE